MSYLALVTAPLLFNDHQNESQVTFKVLVTYGQPYCQHVVLVIRLTTYSKFLFLNYLELTTGLLLYNDPQNELQINSKVLVATCQPGCQLASTSNKVD